MIEIEQSEWQKFSDKEIKALVGIVDTNLTGAQDIINIVTPENLGAIVDHSIETRKARRQVANVETCEGMSVLQLIEEKIARAGFPHAIQCDVQGAQDAAYFIGELKNREVFQNNADVKKIISFFQREIKLRNSLTEFHRIDISRRIGEVKDDEKFFKQEKVRFETALPILMGLLDEYEAVNSDAIKNLSESDRAQLVDDLEKLRQLSTVDFDEYKQSFYEEICDRIGRVVGFDWEMNNADLLVSAKSAWSVESKIKE